MATRITSTVTAEAVVLNGCQTILHKCARDDQSHLQHRQAGGTVEEDSGYSVWIPDSNLGRVA